MIQTRLASRHSVIPTRILAQSTVSDLDTAERWYTALRERGPDARPMPGLLEWYMDETAGLQVWSEPARAGHSTVVIGTDELDASRTDWPKRALPTKECSPVASAGSCRSRIRTETGSC